MDKAAPSSNKLLRFLQFTLLAALCVMAADQLVKWWMLFEVGLIDPAQEPIVVAPFFKLVMVWNYGISFGMLSHPGSGVPWFLKGVAVAICAVVAWLAWHSDRKAEQIAYGAIIGGAIGNVIDRVRFGAVADFFSLHIGEYHWPAFNIADASIFCGVAALLVMSFGKRAK